jgi:CubicO group peptidase (beta-lactamase class C family)
MGHGVSSRTFGHNGAAGQIAWADPVSGLSFGFTISGVDRNFLREARRTTGIASRAAATATA